jgi:hypothetical protein
MLGVNGHRSSRADSEEMAHDLIGLHRRAWQSGRRPIDASGSDRQLAANNLNRGPHG